MLRVLQVGQPSLGGLLPLVSVSEQESGVVGHQQAELQTVVVLRFQEQLQAGVLRVLGNLLRVRVPVPAEGEEGEAVVGGQVDLLLHDLERVVSPTPDRLPIGELVEHPFCEMRGRIECGPRCVVLPTLAPARPAVEVVGAHGRPGLG
jgi:hypothetical protein